MLYIYISLVNFSKKESATHNNIYKYLLYETIENTLILNISTPRVSLGIITEKELK